MCFPNPSPGFVWWKCETLVGNRWLDVLRLCFTYLFAEWRSMRRLR